MKKVQSHFVKASDFTKGGYEMENIVTLKEEFAKIKKSKDVIEIETLSKKIDTVIISILQAK